MKTLLLSALSLLTVIAFAGSPKAVTDLQTALDQARTEGKLLFVQMGRENCGNCQALKAMVKTAQVSLPPAKFVYADVNVDDEATDKLFTAKFNVQGDVLPFVAIAAADGTLLAGRSGGGTAKDFEKLILAAETQARKLGKAAK